MGKKEKVCFVGFDLLKVTLVSAIFYLILGFIFGLGFFFFLDVSVTAFEIEDVPFFGMILLSFLLIPFLVSLIGTLISFLFFLLLSGILKLTKGVGLYLREENLSPVNSNPIEEPYSLPEYDLNN